MKNKISLWENFPGKNDEVTNQVPGITPYICEGAKAAVIVCPGGGYACLCDDYEGSDVCEWLNSIGITAFQLAYRVFPYSYPAPLADIHRAIRYIRHNSEEFGIDKDKIGALGFSAGGHLVSVASTHEHTEYEKEGDEIDSESAQLNAAVLCYPVISMTPLGHKGSTQVFLGGDLSEERIEKFSSERQVSSYTPPSFIWHTFSDSLVDVRNSLYYASACKEHNISCEVHVFGQGEHGLGLAKDWKFSANEWPNLAKRWFTEIGFRN